MCTSFTIRSKNILTAMNFDNAMPFHIKKNSKIISYTKIGLPKNDSPYLLFYLYFFQSSISTPPRYRTFLQNIIKLKNILFTFCSQPFRQSL